MEQVEIIIDVWITNGVESKLIFTIIDYESGFNNWHYKPLNIIKSDMHNADGN